MGIRYFEGRVWRHDPQWDDPDLETDIGPCPDCGGSCVEMHVGFENSVNERPCSSCCDHDGFEEPPHVYDGECSVCCSDRIEHLPQGVFCLNCGTRLIPDDEGHEALQPQEAGSEHLG